MLVFAFRRLKTVACCSGLGKQRQRSQFTSSKCRDIKANAITEINNDNNCKRKIIEVFVLIEVPFMTSAKISVLCTRSPHIVFETRIGINGKSLGNYWYVLSLYPSNFQIKPVIDHSYTVQPLFFNIKVISIR